MNRIKQKTQRPTFPSVMSMIPKVKWHKHFHLGHGLQWRVPQEWEAEEPFQTCATPTATSTPGQAARAAQGSELCWAAMARLNVPGSSALRAPPPWLNPTNKNTLQEESCMSVWEGWCPPHSSNAPLGFAPLVSYNQDNPNTINSPKLVYISLIWSWSDVMWVWIII